MSIVRVPASVDALEVCSGRDLWPGDASLWPSAYAPSGSEALRVMGICSVIVVLRFLRTRGLHFCQACDKFAG